MKKDIVKVRGRYGTSSFDITIPAKIARRYNISAGDLFELSVVEDNDCLKLIYKFIYKNE